MKTIDEMNDEIRARVNEELPRPAGGFETSEAEEAWRDAHEKRFLELCRESADAENRIREAAPELLEACEVILDSTCGDVGEDGYEGCIRIESKALDRIRAAIAKARGGAA